MTPIDWELLSEWADGTLRGEARVAFERRLEADAELAVAARRLRALSGAAAGLAPSAEDTIAAATLATPTPWRTVGGLVVVLAVLAGGALVITGPTSSPPGPAPTGTLEQPAAPSPPVAAPTTPVDAGDSMNRSLDAAVLALLLTTAPDAAVAEGPAPAPSPAPALDASTGQKPVVLAIGGRLRLDAPRTSVRATPSGVVELVEHGDWTSVVGRTPGEVSVETTDGDGGVATSVQVRVEAIISPEVLLRLRPGRRAVVLTPGRVRWSIGDPSIVLVREGEGGLELRGARAGSTTLEAWFQDGSSRKWPVQVEVETETAGSLRLVLGHQKVLSVPSLESVTVTPAGVVDTRRMGSQMLLLIGQGEGLATVEVARAGKPPLRYQVTVTREVVDSITPKRPSTWPVRPLVPVLVAASDLEANTVITLPLITQRSMAEGDDRAAAVGVEAVSHVIGRPILVPLKAGETLRWIHFGLTKSPAPSP